MTKLQHIKSPKHKGFIEFLKDELRNAKLTLSNVERRKEYDSKLGSKHTEAFRDQTRMTTAYTCTLGLMNATLIVSMGAVALWQWSLGAIAIGAVATAIPLAWQLNNIAGWVARSVTSIFENIGTVQDGMRSIDVPRQMPDPADATELRVTGGEIRLENLHFDYGRVRDSTVAKY